MIMSACILPRNPEKKPNSSGSCAGYFAREFLSRARGVVMLCSCVPRERCSRQDASDSLRLRCRLLPNADDVCGRANAVVHIRRTHVRQYAGERNVTAGAARSLPGQGSVDAGRRIRSGGNPPRARRQARRALGETGDRDRAVQGPASRREVAATARRKEEDNAVHAQARETRIGKAVPFGASRPQARRTEGGDKALALASGEAHSQTADARNALSGSAQGGGHARPCPFEWPQGSLARVPLTALIPG